MISNRPALAQALQMTVKEVSELPIDILALLLEETAELKSSAQKAADHMFSAMSQRYSDDANKVRQAKGADTGTVRLHDGDFVIVADLPKKVAWDGAGLAQVEKTLAEMGEPPEDYIQVKRDVSERAFESWPNSLKKLFAPYRTLGVGKAGFKIERKKEGA